MSEVSYAFVTPFVSVCTPTCDRRDHMRGAIQCYLTQTYPHASMEWLILDDGEDSIEDLVRDVPGVRYIRSETKLPIGRKRNILNDMSKGDFVVYFDDDDYYPPERVRHAVETLQIHPHALCAGSSLMYMLGSDKRTIYRLGPWGPKHATANTFAFRRALLNVTSFDDSRTKAEEKGFLKGYTIPFVQLDPLRTILVMQHESNTIDKRPFMRHPTKLRVHDYIPDATTRRFYT